MFEATLGSPTAGVVASALLFGLAHLGGTFHPDRAHVNNSLWLSFTGILLGVITVFRRNELGAAVAVHAVRNAMEFATLLVALSTH